MSAAFPSSCDRLYIACTVGYKDERTLLDAALKWPLNVDPSFEEHWRNECEVIEEGSWGRRLRLFYHEFYGEGFEVAPGQTFRREAGEQPFAGITWSGSVLQCLPCSWRATHEVLPFDDNYCAIGTVLGMVC